jgi:hypothetical protein
LVLFFSSLLVASRMGRLTTMAWMQGETTMLAEIE